MFYSKLVFSKENAKKKSVYLAARKCRLLPGFIAKAKPKKIPQIPHPILEMVKIFELQTSLTYLKISQPNFVKLRHGGKGK